MEKSQKQSSKTRRQISMDKSVEQSTSSDSSKGNEHSMCERSSSSKGDTKAQDKCPFNATTAAQATPRQKLTDLVRIPEDIDTIFALAAQPHHEPYYYMKPAHSQKMNNILRGLAAAGPTVKDGIVKAKEDLKAGVSPNLMRHALGVYLTHSADAQKQKITVPTLKHHAFMITHQNDMAVSSNTPASELTIFPGEVVTPDTFQGPALLSYWREDYDYNDHHVHWHMVFPGNGMVVNGKNVRVIDRQGELFLYMHSQMVARYETEGLCWNLPLVRPWNQYDDILEHGYVPQPGFSEFYGGYPAFSGWFAVKNPNIPKTKDEPVPRATLETWRDNIYQSIKDGYFWTVNPATKERKKFMLTEDNCHNIVGTIIESESTALKTQPDGFIFDEEMYGNLHNFGHDKFAEMGYHNYLTKDNPYSLMISNFGSPRDAAFWPWHKHIQYFGRLSAAKYPQDLTAHSAAVTLSHLHVRPQDEQAPHYPEGITTFMGPPAVNLMESNAKLDHEPYQWSVQIKSARNPSPSKKNPQVITLRLFIVAQTLMEDYHNWIEMDKVTVTLTTSSAAPNIRLDTDSSVARKMSNYSELQAEWASAWCRCGWPQNMMLPVGKIEGMDFIAFCMATDDVIDTDVKTTALSYCGAMQNDRKYPDPRGMGYPFDREWTQHVQSDKNETIKTIISNNTQYPFIATSSFKIFRTTKRFMDVPQPIGPIADITWYNTIKDYFLQSDVNCMMREYGYDLSNYEDVLLHSAAIYDATLNKRMPLQMDPWTEQNPDPDHPFWSTEMTSNFKIWMIKGCPLGTATPTPPPPPPTTDATWDNTIKAYFLADDIACMRDTFDLGNHESVAKNAKGIYEQVSKGKMPLQMKPWTQENPDPKHPMWTKAMCDTFKAWWDSGCK